MEHPINNLLKISMENIHDMIDVDTIIGKPIEVKDVLILPVSKLKFGFAAGGTEQKGTETAFPFGGGSGGSVSIVPTAFLVVDSKGVQVLHLNEDTHIYEKILDFVPKLLEQLEGKFKAEKEV